MCAIHVYIRMYVCVHTYVWVYIRHEGVILIWPRSAARLPHFMKAFRIYVEAAAYLQLWDEPAWLYAIFSNAIFSLGKNSKQLQTLGPGIRMWSSSTQVMTVGDDCNEAAHLTNNLKDHQRSRRCVHGL